MPCHLYFAHIFIVPARVAPHRLHEALRLTLWRGGKAVAILFHTLSDRAIGHAAMVRIEKTVFISYRRADEPWALAIFQDLTQHGYDVFIDYDGIASGSFETAILENIKARAHFLVLLTPTALERSRDSKTWIRREIEAALDSQRNIVPLMLAGFDFREPAIAGQLTGKLAALKEYNGIEIPKGFFAQAMRRLRDRFLNVLVDVVLHPASLSAQQAATEQKEKATMALGEALHQPWLSPEQPRKQEEAAAPTLSTAFISYSRNDRDFVYRLVGDLENAGISVFFDQRVTPGASWTLSISQAIEQAKFLLVVLSPDYVDSEWALEEMKLGMEREAQKKALRNHVTQYVRTLHAPSILPEKRRF
jgi:predicted nucleotide-binding protein